jgi:hypothetical protein
MSSKKILYGIAAIILLIVTVNILEKVFQKKELPADPKEQTEEQRDLAALRALMMERKTPELETGTSEQEDVLKGLKKKKFIRDVFYEKDEVCLGESLEMRVDLQNPDGPVSDLICRIGGKFGDRVILNFDEQGEETVTILAKDIQGNIDMRRIKINVASCPGKAAIILKAVSSPNRTDEAAISIIKKRGLKCPCTYGWDFGDGTNLTTADENVSHYYGKREQNAFSSTFIVTVDVVDSKKIHAKGKTSITFPNILWASKQMGFSIVPIVQETAYGFAGNKYEIGVKIKNIYGDTIVFDTATIHARDCTNEEQSYTETIKANSIMKKTEIKGGEIADDSIVIPQNSIPDSHCGISIMLKGHFPDNTPVNGMVFLLKE